MLSVEAFRAAAVALGAAAPTGDEIVPLREAVGRVLAADVRAPLSLPPFENSAMDGFAVRAADVPAAGTVLPLAGESRAGTPGAAVPPGHATGISTGARMPEGVDAVVPVERTERTADGIRFDHVPTDGDHVRRAGEDVRAGEPVLAAGAPLHPGAIALLAGLGVGAVDVRRRPRVTVVATGDEVVAAGSELRDGEVFDVNGIVLPALLRAAGADVEPVVRVRDDADDTRRAIATATGDLVLTCGGVSMGEHDHVRGALDACGATETAFRVDLQPGKPTWLGTLPPARGADPDGPRRPVIALPGNPASALVTAALFAWPVVAALGGGRAPEAVPARLAAEAPRNRARLRALRATVAVAADGVLEATPLGGQDSHALASLAGTVALALVEAGDAPQDPGGLVPVWPLPWAVLPGPGGG